MIFPFFLRTSLHHLPTTPLKIEDPVDPATPSSCLLSFSSPPPWEAELGLWA